MIQKGLSCSVKFLNLFWGEIYTNFQNSKKRRNVHVGVEKTLDHSPTRRVVVKFTLGAPIILPLGLIFIVRTVRKK